MKGTASRSGAAPTRGDSDHDAVFRALRSILTKIDHDFIVSSDTATRYCLDAGVGTATLKAWGGKLRRPTIPIAWVEHGKTYVSFHLMGLDGAPGVREKMSDALAARRQGKTCFYFTHADETLFVELDRLTARVINAMRAAQYIG